MSRTTQSIPTRARARRPLSARATRSGDLLFLSGVGPRERGTRKIPGVELDAAGNIASYDIEAQVHSVFKNVRAILEDAGSSWDRLVDVTVYLTNMRRDFRDLPIVYMRSISLMRMPWPCRTTVEIAALADPPSPSNYVHRDDG